MPIGIEVIGMIAMSVGLHVFLDSIPDQFHAIGARQGILEPVRAVGVVGMARADRVGCLERDDRRFSRGRNHFE